MEIRVTASVLEAIDVMFQVRGGKIFARTKGVAWVRENPDTLFTKVDRPVWCNYIFFHRIKALPIRRTRRVEPSDDCVGYWELEREVEFYLHGQRVGTVWLIGRKHDSQSLGSGLDNASFWGVSRVGYFRYDGGSREEPPTDWREVELEWGLTGRFIE